jgi:hypothetical protein
MILQMEGIYFRGNQAKDIPTDISRRHADAGCKHVKPSGVCRKTRYPFLVEPMRSFCKFQLQSDQGHSEGYIPSAHSNARCKLCKHVKPSGDYRKTRYPFLVEPVRSSILCKLYKLYKLSTSKSPSCTIIVGDISHINWPRLLYSILKNKFSLSDIKYTLDKVNIHRSLSLSLRKSVLK